MKTAKILPLGSIRLRAELIAWTVPNRKKYSSGWGSGGGVGVVRVCDGGFTTQMGWCGVQQWPLQVQGDLCPTRKNAVGRSIWVVA